MPPHVPRKRRSASPAPASRHKCSKVSVFDSIDGAKPITITPHETKVYLDNLNNSESSLSDAPSDDEFEDVPPATHPSSNGVAQAPAEPDDDEENMDWEEVNVNHSASHDEEPDIQDVTFTIKDDGSAGPQIEDKTAYVRKGPSKRDRQVRNGTHQIHVQCLMWHNAVRNAWLCDKDLQRILLEVLSDSVKEEIDTWRRDMGLPTKFDKKQKGAAKKRRAAAATAKITRGGRDWGQDADHLEKDAVNMSRADPLLRLLKILCVHWRKRFKVTAPGLRKLGYMSLRGLKEEINGWKKDMKDFERHGERVASLDELKKLARKGRGSRDVGAQLFTALLRSLGFEARMIANLQPAGIGFGKSEDATPRGKASKPVAPVKPDAPDGTEARPKKVVIKLDSDTSGLSEIEADDLEKMPSPTRGKRYDRDLHFPIYWTEVLSPISKTFIPVDAMVLSTVATNAELLASFEPRGKLADQAKQVMCYTIAHSADGSAKDVTVRYLKRHQLPGRTKGYRMPIERIKILNKRGKVLRHEDYDWFKTVMSGYERREHLRTTNDDIEDNSDLKPLKSEASAADKKISDNSEAFYKASAEYVLEKHLRREEALPKDARPVKEFTYTKAGKALTEPVYKRSEVVACKTAESWHKEGRQIKVGEQAMKWVPIRAVTAVRKAEIQAIERETGEKAKQGLFSREQTEWIIPPPIGPDRQIPRNAFNNIDIYTPSMVPEGAVHLPLRGTMRICENMGIPYAEACVGFEFGNKRAVPVIQGVVVPSEHAEAVREAWKVKEAERQRKEDAKKQVLVLSLWKKMVVGLRIVARLRSEYHDIDDGADAVNPFVKKAKPTGEPGLEHSEAGGFLRSGEEDEDDDDDDDETHQTRDMTLDLDHASAAGLAGSGAHRGISDRSHGPETPEGVDVALGEPIRGSNGSLVGEAKDKQITEARILATSAGIRKPASKARRASRKRSERAPTRSKYFAKDGPVDDDNPDRGDKIDTDSSSDEQEVIRPRRTTARTRASKA